MLTVLLDVMSIVTSFDAPTYVIVFVKNNTASSITLCYASMAFICNSLCVLFEVVLIILVFVSLIIELLAATSISYVVSGNKLSSVIISTVDFTVVISPPGSFLYFIL